MVKVTIFNFLHGVTMKITNCYMHDQLSPKCARLRSRDVLNFCKVIAGISKTVQDRDILSLDHQ